MKRFEKTFRIIAMFTICVFTYIIGQQDEHWLVFFFSGIVIGFNLRSILE